MGLTGIVVDATVRLLPIETSRCLVLTERVPNLDSLLERMETGDHLHRYSVAWVDMVATGAHLGRAVLTRGDHATYEQLVAERPSAGDDPLAFAPAGLAAVPPGMPNVLNRLAVRAFNELWYRKAPSSHLGLESITGFFHPLDMVGDWNRLYGRGGFLQYQFVVPFEAVDTLRTIVATVAVSGHASFLAVLKRFGPESGGLLSFPTPGWTLTLDLPAAVAGLGGLVGELDRMVLDAGGRHYLAKDATATPEIIRAGYPRLDEWLQIRRTVDPTGRWISDQARRLDLY
jgi:decaprenylphospho-beta-D-ribofuranose 2-oxidase